MRTNYIFIVGGVLSGLGKGIVTASIGRILKSKGFNVTAIKIDPYINWDAGTMRPTEHGEVWVTEDGGEIDQDLGHYERFLDINISKAHNITTGQVYYAVIERERAGKYLGKTVQPIPHITDEIKSRIKNVSVSTKAEFVLVEIGGVVGDYENVLFLEAARQMKVEANKVLFIHVTYLPVLKVVGEMKTKPTQHSVMAVREIGIQPDFIVCRSDTAIDEPIREKIALFCNVLKEDIISDPDVDNVYKVPLEFEKQGFGNKILSKLGLETAKSNLTDWRQFVENMNAKRQIPIGIVGKYFDIGNFRLPDAYISVIEAIKHAAAANSVRADIRWIVSTDFEKTDINIELLENVCGIIVPGGFGHSGVEGKIAAINVARENNIPYLGLCFGLQLAVVEFARNVCGLEGAHSTEIDETTKYPVVDFLPWQKKLIAKSKYGATMRLGGQIIKIKPNTLAHKLYGKNTVLERFRHRYEINPKYVDILEKHGFVFSGESEKDEGIMQIGELPREKHNFFIGTQGHPEFTSRPLKPNPLFNGFMKACMS
ncbi:MAG: CTP synthase [Candidatus Bathyarchaeia archaeon]